MMHHGLHGLQLGSRMVKQCETPDATWQRRGPRSISGVPLSLKRLGDELEVVDDG